MERLKGLMLPPSNWLGSMAPPLLGTGSPVELLPWSTIRAIALDGKHNGAERYGLRFHTVQRHNNCAGAAASKIVAKTIYDARGAILSLSDTYTYSLINGGRDQGSMLSDAMNAIESNGVCLAETCGPESIYPRQYDKRQAADEAERFRVTECYAIRRRDFANDDELQRALWTALCLGFKVGIACQCGNNFDTVNADGVPGVDRGYGNHALHADGIAFVGGGIVATVENTWPLSYRNGGRINLRWQHFAETVGVHEFYAARGARGDTKDERPKVKA